jgi:hypothetical protein
MTNIPEVPKDIDPKVAEFLAELVTAVIEIQQRVEKMPWSKEVK